MYLSYCTHIILYIVRLRTQYIRSQMFTLHWKINSDNKCITVEAQKKRMNAIHFKTLLTWFAFYKCYSLYEEKKYRALKKYATNIVQNRW